MCPIYFYISRFPVECLYAYKHTDIRAEVHIYFLWCVSVYIHCGVQCVYTCASLKSAALRSVPRVSSQLITAGEGAHWPAPDCQWLKQPGIVWISCLKVSQVRSKSPGEQWNPGNGGESLPSE